MADEIQVKGFFSKYPFNQETRKNKTVLYEGNVRDIPEDLKNMTNSKIIYDFKFVIIYRVPSLQGEKENPVTVSL